jgi:predicted MFS family arabinose efflux permease
MPPLAELEPLRSPAYRRYLIGWTLYGTASWIFYTAITWTFLISDGAAAAVAFLPAVLVIPVPFALIVSGTLTDRRGPRDIAALGLALNGLVMGSAAVLVLTGTFTFVPTLIVGFLSGVASGLVTVPAQTLLLRLVEQRHASAAAGSALLTNAVARILGGPIGGAVLAVVGPVPAFLIAGLGAFLGAATFLTLPRLTGFDERPKRTSVLDLGRALRWAARARGVLAVIGLSATLALFVLPYLSMLSVVARDLVGGSAAAMGLLVGAGGVGVAIGAFAIHVLNRRFSRGRVLVGTLVASAIGLAALGLSGELAISLLLAALIGACTNMFGATETVLVQTMTPPAIRGRVLAVDGVAFNIANPLGTLIAGLLIAPLGARTVLVLLSGLGLVATALIVASRRGILWVGINEQGELDDPRLSVRALEPDAERGLPSPLPAPGPLVAAAVEEVDARLPSEGLDEDEATAARGT